MKDKNIDKFTENKWLLKIIVQRQSLAQQVK